MRKITFVLLALFGFGLSLTCAAQSAPAKRPMTFEDMMKMKRLGETAVSPDGKWLAYSVTTVNLDQNTKTAELWLQAIAGGESHEAGGCPARRQRSAVRSRWASGCSSSPAARVGSRSGSRTSIRRPARRATRRS